MTERLKKGYLQWRCRRGTKELDVILTRFLDSCYDTLSDQELRALDELLQAQDTHLWSWLSAQQSPESHELKHIIDKIRHK